MERVTIRKRRVDIEVPEDVLRWAAIEAAKAGISRRKYIVRCLEYAKSAADELQEQGMEFIIKL